MLIIRVQCNLPGRKEEKEESFNLLERVRLMLFVLSYAEISVLYQSLESKMACPVSCFFHKCLSTALVKLGKTSDVLNT